MRLQDAGGVHPEGTRGKFDSPRCLHKPGAVRIVRTGPGEGNYYPGVYADLPIGARHNNPRPGRPDAFTDTGRSALSEPDRFMSPDLPRCQNKRAAARVARTGPLGGSADNPQSLNCYTCALNNPETLTDPLGLLGDFPPEPLPYTLGDPGNGCWYVLSYDVLESFTCGPWGRAIWGPQPEGRRRRKRRHPPAR